MANSPPAGGAPFIPMCERSGLSGAEVGKMADRGQISGGLVDGPLAFDNAVSFEAARAKGIVSPVAGSFQISNLVIC
jgi:phosphotransacetylase